MCIFRGLRRPIQARGVRIFAIRAVLHNIMRVIGSSRRVDMMPPVQATAEDDGIAASNTMQQLQGTIEVPTAEPLHSKTSALGCYSLTSFS